MRSAAAAGILLTACSIANARPVPAACEFPDAVPLAFAGETTLRELGIPAAGEEHERVFAWVTAPPIHFPSSAEDHRASCVQRADGSFERSVYPGALQRTLSP
jgi:hypothetical protein